MSEEQVAKASIATELVTEPQAVAGMGVMGTAGPELDIKVVNVPMKTGQKGAAYKVNADSKEALPKMIHTVFGVMVDPHSGIRYDMPPQELLKLTGWVQAQLDAGKMKYYTAE